MHDFSSTVVAVLAVLFIVYFIVAATYNERRSSPIAAPAPEISGGSPAQNQVLRRYKQWRLAWATRDLKECMSFYAPNLQIFHERKLVRNYQKWQAHLQKQWDAVDRTVADPQDWQLIKTQGEYVIIIMRPTRQIIWQAAQKEDGKPHTWQRQQVWHKEKGVWMIVAESCLEQPHRVSGDP
ncbi:MAG TPA: nuclear transport factor 2 family protein [Abditibacteriaceae bacterium]|nr:nuclear transport factor 2 family protein [Abditibacteriaceae bacterium]